MTTNKPIEKMTVDEAVNHIYILNIEYGSWDFSKSECRKKLEELIQSQREQAVEEYKASQAMTLEELRKRIEENRDEIEKQDPWDDHQVVEIIDALEHLKYDLESYDDELGRSVDIEFGHLYTTFGDLKTIVDYFKTYPPLATSTSLGWLPIADEQKDGKGYNCGYWEDGKWKTGYFHYFNDPFNELSEWLTQDSCDIGIEPTHYFPIDLVPVPAMEDKE